MRLHEKMDDLRNRQMEALLLRQQAQIELLTQLLGHPPGGTRPAARP